MSSTKVTLWLNEQLDILLEQMEEAKRKTDIDTLREINAKAFILKTFFFKATQGDFD